jgi:hypothetical protein
MRTITYNLVNDLFKKQVYVIGAVRSNSSAMPAVFKNCKSRRFGKIKISTNETLTLYNMDIVMNTGRTYLHQTLLHYNKIASRGDFRWHKEDKFVTVQWNDCKDCKVVTVISHLHLIQILQEIL